MTEAQALKRPFLIGLLATTIVFLLVGGVIAVFATSTDDRPEGIAERWLTAAGDLTRDGVHADAVKRVEAHGDLELADLLTGQIDADGKSAFSGLEVGRARRDGTTALVPAQVVTRDHDAKRDIVIVLTRTADSWRVSDFRPADPTLRVPSDGGDVAAKAPVALYAVAMVIGVGVAAAASAMVRLAGREQEQLSLV